MKDSNRLTFIPKFTNEDLNQLWKNCFSGNENLNHINAHVPIPVQSQNMLNSYLLNQNGYKVWLIKRKIESDIIGYTIHGDLYGDYRNNIGFTIGLNYTKSGYATEALIALIDYLRETGLKETFGHCFESNIVSIRIMEKCGFENLGEVDSYNGIPIFKFKIQL